MNEHVTYLVPILYAYYVALYILYNTICWLWSPSNVGRDDNTMLVLGAGLVEKIMSK